MFDLGENLHDVDHSIRMTPSALKVHQHLEVDFAMWTCQTFMCLLPPVRWQPLSLTSHATNGEIMPRLSNLVPVAICVVLSSLLISNVAAQDAARREARKQLSPLSFLVGEWTGQYRSPADVPEVGAKKGATVVQRLSTHWILNGAAIEMSFQTSFDGKPQAPSKELIAWDPGEKRISHVIVDGSGFFGNGTWRAENGDWLLDWSVSTNEGTYSGTSIHREESDSTYFWQMVNMKKDDKKLPDWPKVEFKRVASVREQWLGYLAGKWDFTLGDGRAGVVTYSSVGKTPALAFAAEAKDFSITGVIGWSEVEQMLVESDFVTQDGAQARLHREFPQVTAKTLTGTQSWWDTKLGKGGQALEYRRINDNEMTLTGKASDSGGTDWVVRFKRKK